MALVDGIALGQPILPDSHFASTPAYYEDWSNGMDFETSSAPGNLTGKWKKGAYADNWCRSGATWGFDEANHPGSFLHWGNNRESQVFEGTRRPAPEPINTYEIVNGVLRINSMPVTPANQDWARVKKAIMNPDGSVSVPQPTSFPNSPDTPLYGNNNDLSFTTNYPADYTSGSITTFGRFAGGYARYRWKAKSPYGADGASPDINQRRAIFPAAGWMLQEFKYGCDANGEPIDGDQKAYSPGRYYIDSNGVKRKASGTPEIDVDESFGAYTDKIHQTVHLHADTRNAPYAGTSYLYNNASTIDVGYDIRANWTESGVDLIPHPTQPSLGLIAFFINGVYTKIVPMTPEMYDPMPRYLLHPTQRYNIQGVDQNEIQTYANGDPRYMHWCLLSNLQRDGKYPRDLAYQRRNSGDMPAHTETCSMEIDYIGCWPLYDDNPDTHGFSLRGVETATDSGASFDSSAPDPDDIGGGGGTDPDDGTPSVSSRSRTTGYVTPIGVTKKGRAITLKFVPPEGLTNSDFSYVWSVSGEDIVAISGNTDFYFTFEALTSSAADEAVVTCEETPL